MNHFHSGGFIKSLRLLGNLKRFNKVSVWFRSNSWASESKEGKNGFCSKNQQLKINKLIGYLFFLMQFVIKIF